MTKLYEAENHILIHTGYDNPTEHRHTAAHIIISLDACISVTANRNTELHHGVMIPSAVSHKIETFEQPALIFLFDCTTNVARQISKIQSIPERICRQIVQMYLAFEKHPSPAQYRKFQEYFLEMLNLPEPNCLITDTRIAAAMDYIRRTAPEHITCREAADFVYLSQSRFSHLFKSQIGMTFSAYLIYQRIMHVYTKILRGSSITEASLEAGFSGSSHFADVNRRVFGISASRITQELVFIKV